MSLCGENGEQKTGNVRTCRLPYGSLSRRRGVLGMIDFVSKQRA
jgi:hypothetical protein